jgi:hypothetical protein
MTTPDQKEVVVEQIIAFVLILGGLLLGLWECSQPDCKAGRRRDL